MKLVRMEIPLAQFRALSDDDQAVILLAAQMQNELICLRKLVLWTWPNYESNDDAFAKIDGMARLCQSSFLLRTLVGKMFAIVELFEKGDKSHSISQEDKRQEFTFSAKDYFTHYRTKLSKKADDAFDLLSAFSRENSKIRNKVAFYYSVAFIKPEISAIHQEEMFVVQIDSDIDSADNSLAFFGEAAVARAIIRDVPEDKFDDNWLLYFRDEVLKTSESATFFLSNLIEVIFQNIPSITVSAKAMTSNKLPNFESIQIPYFSEVPCHSTV